MNVVQNSPPPLEVGTCTPSQYSWPPHASDQVTVTDVPGRPLVGDMTSAAASADGAAASPAANSTPSSAHRNPARRRPRLRGAAMPHGPTGAPTMVCLPTLPSGTGPLGSGPPLPGQIGGRQECRGALRRAGGASNIAPGIGGLPLTLRQVAWLGGLLLL